MTKFVLHGLDAVQAEFFALIEGDPELRTAFTAIAESIESGEASVFERSMSDWLKWLDDEGYSAQTVQDNSNRFVSLLHDAGISHLISGDTKTNYLVQELKQVPHLLELLFTLFDHSLTLHSDVVGAAGGTGLARGKIVAKRLGVDRKKLAIREGAGEAREASSEFDSTARDGQSQGGLNDRGLEPRRDEFGGRAQDVADRISTAREGRYVTREDGLNDRGLEPRRDYMPTGAEMDYKAEMRETTPGSEGATENRGGESQRAADRISTAREGRYVTREDGLNDRGMEPRRDYMPTGGERDARAEIVPEEGRNGAGVESPATKAYDDVREVVREEREPIIGGKGGVERPEARRYDDVREVIRDERDPITYASREDDLNDRGIEPRRDYMPTGAEMDYKAEMRETTPGSEGATENRGGESQRAADRISTAREGRYVTREDGLNDRGMEPRRDYMPTGGERDARAEIVPEEGRNGGGLSPEASRVYEREERIERRADMVADDVAKVAKLEMPGRNGGGVESPAAKAFDDVRTVVREEREPIMGGKGGVESPEARRYDDVREERIEMRADMVADDVAKVAKLEMPGRNGGGVESPAAKAFDDVRTVVREEREPIMGGKGGVESPEARRYDDVREERIEMREDMVAKDVAELEMPGRNGGGVESPAAKAFDDVRTVVREEREPIMGGKGGVESPEARRYDDVREERIEMREDMVAKDVAELEMPGRNGGGVESPAAKAFDDVRTVVREEREPIMGGKGGVESPEARRYDDVREERIEMREDMVAKDVAELEMPGRNGGGVESPAARRYDDVREVIRDERDPITYATREDGLNDRGLEPRRDYMPTDGELDAKAEMRETKPDMLGATE
ncbi:hypothetical protein SynWH8101_1416 [Synechococcus sp. WH 8101]|uniref:hypothetical protein n=1 Tax=Synechococcus sp. WH 8101 TaxID=59932 RepID=UPI001023E9B8|nr:hypothetical protein [Synechococcus sp. WH 8101]QBE69000.1 hypothetical protein SynWH8101_1416 [Synechococcus sp. WH 8101]